ncbi:MAG: thioredoxin domain-containing protein, partial [Alphaproteobacteria bacterium]|nr:thioredoxin domain-containing protein [Alphaproteobacteria bacterium]
MTSVFKAFFKVFAAVLLLAAALPAHAAPAAAAPSDPRMELRTLGNPNAPVRVDEFVSLTCPHCAEFYNDTLPKLEPAYIKTGKVKFVLHDFPIDGPSLKAAALARCMPKDEYFPFIEVLYKNQAVWAYGGGNPDDHLVDYAKLGGMTGKQARACL